MFEEAEEIMMQKVIKENDCIMTPCKTLEDCQLCDFCFDDIVNAYKDGAEYGYNKANEWHYVKDGDLPKHDNDVLVLLKDETMQVDYYFSKIGWNISVNADVIAWKEIVLPEE